MEVVEKPWLSSVVNTLWNGIAFGPHYLFSPIRLLSIQNFVVHQVRNSYSQFPPHTNGVSVTILYIFASSILFENRFFSILQKYTQVPTCVSLYVIFSVMPGFVLHQGLQLEG